MDDVRITIDAAPHKLIKGRDVIIIYALPNGNTTEQTMGKKMEANDDWHLTSSTSAPKQHLYGKRSCTTVFT
ncbi:MAG TPA: hypothetical protein VD993_01215 [Chitinophagaceae bacterium]|nr:hypothetical protein [Chitinophagaceae bacterium]